MTVALSYRRLCVLALLMLLLARPVVALEPGEMLPDPALEARARTISKELRCLVCQNESIDASHSDFAKDLRLVVRERLVAGDSDRQVITHIEQRFGDMVLLRPPVRAYTLALWFGPLLLLAVGGLIAWRTLRRNRQRTAIAGMPGADALSETERARLATLLAEDEGDSPAKRGDGPAGG